MYEVIVHAISPSVSELVCVCVFPQDDEEDPSSVTALSAAGERLHFVMTNTQSHTVVTVPGVDVLDFSPFVQVVRVQDQALTEMKRKMKMPLR